MLALLKTGSTNIQLIHNYDRLWIDSDNIVYKYYIMTLLEKTIVE